MDTTFGVFLNWVFLGAFMLLATRFQWTSVMVTGDYGNPIRIRYMLKSSSSASPVAVKRRIANILSRLWLSMLRNWLAQLLSWILIIFLTKLVIAIFIVALEKPLGAIAMWVFTPLQPYPRVELALVMIACPVLMNALQFWIQDSFLKKDIRDDCVLVASSSKSQGDHVSEKSALTDASSSSSSSPSSSDGENRRNKTAKLATKPVELDNIPV